LGPHDQCGPQQVGVCWYGVRVWIELGFWALKGVGWQWHHARRTAPARVARHWLVLAVAMLGSLAFGTRAEDAEHQGIPPARLVRPLAALPRRTPHPGQCLSPRAPLAATHVRSRVSVAVTLAVSRPLA
jgi:hypothetical protein